MRGCHVIIFDFDGVLIWGGERPGEPRDLGLRSLKHALESGYRVYVYSGRPPGDRGFILSVLREASIPAGRLAGVYLRGRRGLREVDAKHLIVGRVIDREGCVAEVHDDNPEVLYSLRRVVGGGVLHQGDSCSVVYGSTVMPWCMRP